MLSIVLSNQTFDPVSNDCRSNFPAGRDTHSCALSAIGPVEKYKMRTVGLTTMVKDLSKIFSLSQPLLFGKFLLSHL